MSSRAQIDEAANAFESFTGHRARKMHKISDALPAVAWQMGNVEFIGYSTVRDGRKEKYVHDFKGRRPTLAIAHDGKSAHILGGEFRVTKRGFIDREE